MSWLKLFGAKKAEETIYAYTDKHGNSLLTRDLNIALAADAERKKSEEEVIVPLRTIHEVIREARTSQGITQVFLAKKCGISETYLRKIEAGEDSPSLKCIRKIATALNTPLTFTITPE